MAQLEIVIASIFEPEPRCQWPSSSSDSKEDECHPDQEGVVGEGEVEGLSGSSFLNRLLNYTALKGFQEIGGFLDHVFRNEGIYLG